jgi:hypothetical protein
MKKLFFSYMFLTFILFSCQPKISSEFQLSINECIDLLGKPVPSKDFKLVGENLFLRDSDNTLLITENDLVVFSYFGYYHETVDKLEELISIFRIRFKMPGWEYYETFSSGYEVYRKNGVFAGILNPVLRDDGNFATRIGFSKTLFFFDF